MSQYLPHEKTFVVCSNQVNSAPGVLYADDSKRKLSVAWRDKEKPLLTNADLVLKYDFECKSNWASAAATSFFMGGLLLGAAVAFSVCTFGLGAVIIGTVLISTVVLAKSNSVKCNPNLNKWENVHTNVSIDGNIAVVQQSFIICNVDTSIIKPFLDISQARAAATRISMQNVGEVGLTGFVAGLFGFALGKTLFTGGVVMMMGEAVIGVLGAYCIFNPVSTIEKNVFRYFAKGDENSIYDMALAEKIKGELPFVVDSADDPYLGKDQLLIAIESISYWDKKRTYKQNKRYVKEIDELKGTENQRIAEKEILVEKLKRTEIGTEAVENMKNTKGEVPFRERNLKRGHAVLDKNFIENEKIFKSNAREALIGEKKGLPINAVGIILPLLISPLSEWTFFTLANADNSGDGGVKISSK